MLTGVSGVGPRLALALLSSQSTANLQGAISQGNVESLSSAPGVGRRTAGRIVAFKSRTSWPTASPRLPQCPAPRTPRLSKR
ncbi:Holliday junction ATP-dependent DNA helicase RuvA [Geodia barretti]|uniref:Holliday junction ATP-dependent DNA helicase RuvA n=1 Tax=Geodia barretti TaxID=519541 RepID=A0AA35SP40_GEOBA|nr:Holliday junction ATP-dependent DNA helicase RuvA [Geodia barretti]